MCGTGTNAVHGLHAVKAQVLLFVIDLSPWCSVASVTPGKVSQSAPLWESLKLTRTTAVVVRADQGR